jgi:hypothetical protein
LAELETIRKENLTQQSISMKGEAAKDKARKTLKDHDYRVEEKLGSATL